MKLILSYFAVVYAFLITCTEVDSLGSASTIAVIYGTATVCGIIAREPTQRIQCFKNGQTISIKPTVSFEAISGGHTFFCGLRSGGFSVFCWETNAANFQTKRIYYNDTVPLTDLTVGDDQVCAREVNSGIAKCWRGKGRGRSPFPSPSIALRFSTLTSGTGFTCGILRNNSTVYCWGHNNNNVGAEIQRQFGSLRMLYLVAGQSHACGLSRSGYLVCKGSNNEFGKLDVPSSSAFEFSGLALGSDFSCAIKQRNGLVKCWGEENKFQLNANILEDISFELIVSGLDFTCGLTTNNLSMTCWGQGWSNNGNDVPLGMIIPGPCVQSSCSNCGICTIIYCLCRFLHHNSGQPSITNDNVNAATALTTNGSISTTPSLRSFSVLKHHSSTQLGRQKSTSSSRHTNKVQKFSLSELVFATNNFSLENKIGYGSFGIVYKGKLADGHEVAIKRGDIGIKIKKFPEKEGAFDSEIALLSRLHHKHLVELVGFCDEKDERLLVYEYMCNGALYDHLHNKNNIEKSSSILNSWKMRIKIALDVARGIEYLHNFAVPHIIHRDIKSSNILLDANWTAKVSDFGLSLTGPCSDKEFKPSKAVGTVGYIDPEYYVLNVPTAKIDVYGLGVVLLELLTGKKAVFKAEEEGAGPTGIVEYATPLISTMELQTLLDKRVGSPQIHEAEAVELMAYTAMHCVSLEGKERPNIDQIVANLERALALCEETHASFSTFTFSIPSD
ncbi:putative serine/threonine-protein kinase-like protein CCR3 [Jatropha curcas]|uniref:putative serine/threonine-protein kinase-like protein CCR3 n=1 Tax=Jatropha curcas TaxID=180498 RepID=UPI001892EFF8|nr:putative serine/threonine-protein kinase-like protein CCR3 [Jatropha curcas]